MNEGYFIVRSTEDGTRIEGPLTESEVISRITPDRQGWAYYGENLEFLDRVPESDNGCWCVGGNPVLVIKGSIVVPQPVSAVTQYRLP